MKIDITALNQNNIDYLEIDEDIKLDVLDDADIKELKNLRIKGYLKLNEVRSLVIELELTGVMVILDSISLDAVDYPFATQISEILEKNEENLTNSIDLSEILWQNIVLEVPLRFTKVENLDEFKGEGWTLLDEEDLKKSNNPFEELKSMFGEE